MALLHDPDHNMRFLGIIRHNAERLARLTEDLLTLSRIEQKRQKFEFESHLVDGLLKDAMDQVRPIAEKSDIRLEEDSLSPEGTQARGATARPYRRFSATCWTTPSSSRPPEAGSRWARVRPSGTWKCTSADTGIGIPAEDLPRLFERFYRVDKARSRELGGTGLGLSIVKHLVAALGGATRVESVVGQGSTFSFTLPADEAAAGRDPA